MQSSCNETEIRTEQGFSTYVLRSAFVEVAVVPELGARIISLRNRKTGREWMWHPDGGLKLFRNRMGDDFSVSTLAGVDECLPTIAPCWWQGRLLPDHGEVWTADWIVNRQSWKSGVLKTTTRLPLSPFIFQRTIELGGNTLRLSYVLKNQSAAEETYLWALHPLLRIQEGDRLMLPQATRAQLNGDPWIDALGSTIPTDGCAKVFAGPVTEGLAGVKNPETGDGLFFTWNPGENNLLGLWLTRGGWHGHHHFAIEPTNGAPDPLNVAADQKRCGTIAGHGTATWSVALRVE